jgi:hypothetical protein
MGSLGQSNSEKGIPNALQWVNLGIGRDIERAQRFLLGLFLTSFGRPFFPGHVNFFCYRFQVTLMRLQPTLMRINITYYLPQRFRHRGLPLSDKST